jgi:hypothetical protein
MAVTHAGAPPSWAVQVASWQLNSWSVRRTGACMSYDFHLVRVPEGGDVEAAVQLHLERDESEAVSARDPIKEKWKAGLCEALRRCDPSLEPFEFDYATIARELGTSEDEARAMWRHIELNTPEDGPGIQITIDDDSVTITVPYWHAEQDARAVFAKLREHIVTLCGQGGLVVYDPQLERTIDMDRDMDDVLKRYVGVIDRIPEIIQGVVDDKKKRWWKFW